ncbi:hypothetical protein D3C80_1361650 [compost metagenome]
MGQQILAGACLASNEQRRGKIRQFTRLIDHVSHLRTDRNHLAKCTHILIGKILQLSAHTNGGTQHDHRPREYRRVVLALQMNRRDFHQEILAVDNDVFA